MSEAENNKWIKNNLFGIIAVVMSLMHTGYYGIIKGNNDTNRIGVLETEAAKTELKLQTLEEKKVDKEVFMMIQTSLAGIQIDIREIRTNQLTTSIKKF